jgi:hypothetical protein
MRGLDRPVNAAKAAKIRKNACVPSHPHQPGEGKYSNPGEALQEYVLLSSDTLPSGFQARARGPRVETKVERAYHVNES